MSDTPPLIHSEDFEVDLILRGVLRDVLGLSEDRVDGFDADTGLFGH